MANNSNIYQDSLSKAVAILSQQNDKKELQDHIQQLLTASEEKQDEDTFTSSAPAVPSEVIKVLQNKAEEEHKRIDECSAKIRNKEEEAKLDLLTTSSLYRQRAELVCEKSRLIIKGPHPKYYEEIIKQATDAIKQMMADGSAQAYGVLVDLDLELAALYQTRDDREQVYRLRKRAYRHAQEGQSNVSLTDEKIKELKEQAQTAYWEYIAQLKARRDFCAGIIEGQAKAAEINKSIIFVMDTDRDSEMNLKEQEVYNECKAIEAGTKITSPEEKSSLETFPLYEEYKKPILKGEASYFIFKSWCEMLLSKTGQSLNNAIVSTPQLEADLTEIELGLSEIGKIIQAREQKFLLSSSEYLESHQYRQKITDYKVLVDARLQKRRNSTVSLLDQALSDSMSALHGGGSRRPSVWQEQHDVRLTQKRLSQSQIDQHAAGLENQILELPTP